MTGELLGQRQLGVGESQDTPGRRRSPSRRALEPPQEYLCLCNGGWGRVLGSCLSQLLFCQEQGWTFLALPWRWPDCRFHSLGGGSGLLLPFSRTLLASHPSPGWFLGASRPRERFVSALVSPRLALGSFTPTLWSLPQPLDASQSIQFLLSGSTRCLWGQGRVTRC